MNFRVTSGGMESAAPPTRDCVGEVVEKHCVRWEEKAGARKTGRDPCFKGLRDSCLKQLWARERDMAVIIEGLMLDDGGENLRFPTDFARARCG